MIFIEVPRTGRLWFLGTEIVRRDHSPALYGPFFNRTVSQHVTNSRHSLLYKHSSLQYLILLGSNDHPSTLNPCPFLE